MFESYGRITAGLVVVSSQGADGFPGPVGVPGEKGKKVTAQKRQTVIKTLKSTNIYKYIHVHSCEYNVFLRVHRVLQGPPVRGDLM